MKPDALERNLHWVLLRRIEERCGLRLGAVVMLTLLTYDVYALYKHQSEQPFWNAMTDYLLRGPVIAAIFEGDHAIEKVRAEVGHYDKSKSYYVTPGGQSTIRTGHGDSSKPNHVNLVHASSGIAEYEKERLWLIDKITRLV